MAEFELRCVECGRIFAESPTRMVCEGCGRAQEAGGVTRGLLSVDLEAPPRTWPRAKLGSPEFLETFLPLPVGKAETLLPPVPVGSTPLLEAPGLRKALAMPDLWIKDDSRNPSGSTKDRASMLVVAKARQYGFDTIATASSGNAASALAAMCAASGLRAVAIVPSSVPEAKLVQLRCYGAVVLPVDGTYDEAFELCLAVCDRYGWYNRNTALNPFTTEGKKTVSLEIAAQLAPEMPEAVVVPVGDGVILSGVAKGFADLVRGGLLPRLPRLIAVQPTGSAALVEALRRGATRVTPIAAAITVADSLAVEAPRGASMALEAVRGSGGVGVTVSDEAIIDAITDLARHTGVFAEPAGAVALAGLRAARDDGLVERDERIVLLVTGSGLKDVATVATELESCMPVAPSFEAISARLTELEIEPLGGRAGR